MQGALSLNQSSHLIVQNLGQLWVPNRLQKGQVFPNTSHVMPFNAHIHTRYQLGLCEPLWFLARRMIMATFLTLMIPQLTSSVPTGPLSTGCLSNILSD